MILTALEVTESELVLVAAKPSGKGVEIVHAENIPREKDGLAKAIALIPGSYRHGTLVIPRGQALLREFQIPAGSLEETIQMVHFQMEREFPLPANQVRSSFSWGKVRDGRKTVQVAAVPNDVLDPLLDELKKGGFRVDAVTVSTFGLAKLVSFESEPVVIVGKSGSQAEILVSNQGDFSVTRTANIPGDQELEEAIKIEIDRSVLAFQARSKGADVKRIIIPLSLEELGLNGKLSVASDVLWDIHMASALGVCLAGKGGLPNLLKPPVFVKRFRLKKLHRFGIAALVLLALVIFLSMKLVSDREEDLAGLQSELKKIKPKVTHLKRKDANLKLARGWKQSKRFPWHELFKSLNETDVKPENLYLLTATFEETGSVKFSGKVRNSEYNKEFRKELEELPYLRNVEPGPVIQSRDGKNMDDFSVKAQLVKTAK